MSKRTSDLEEKRRKAQEAFLTATNGPVAPGDDRPATTRSSMPIQRVVPVEQPKEPTLKATFNLPVSLVEEMEIALAPRGKLRKVYRNKTDMVIAGLRRLLEEV
jgi:hypothetical protein